MNGICLTCGKELSKAKYTQCRHCMMVARWKDESYRSKIARERFPLIERFWHYLKIGSEAECWEWQGPLISQKCPYGALAVRGHRRVLAHRLSWEIHNGPIPEGLFICHTCDNPRCCNPKHLYAGTSQDNMRDKAQRGKGYNQGEAQWRAKLTNEQVLTIRKRRAAGGCTLQSLADEYGVNKGAIWSVVHRKSWVHI